MTKLDSMNTRDITEMLHGLVTAAFYQAHFARLGPPHRELKLVDVVNALREIIGKLE